MSDAKKILEWIGNIIATEENAIHIWLGLSKYLVFLTRHQVYWLYCLQRLDIICCLRSAWLFLVPQRNPQREQLIKIRNIGEHENKDNRQNPTTKTNHFTNHSQSKTKLKQKKREEEQKEGVTEPWPNIIANLK